MRGGILIILFLITASVHAQHWEWARYATSDENGYQEGICVAVDPTGHYVYAAGYYGDTTVFDGNELPIAYQIGDLEFPFVVKYDSAGNMIWVRYAIAQHGAGILGIATDGQGNVYVAGYYDLGNVTFGTFVLNNPGNEGNFFLVKYNAAGIVQWVRSATGNVNQAVAYGVTCDKAGRIWVTGVYSGTSIQIDSVSFPDTYCTNPALCQGGLGDNYFTAVFTSAGNLLFADYPSDTGYSWATAISANVGNPEGAVYITGSFQSPQLKMGSFILNNTDTAYNNGASFIAKYDSTGNIAWAKSTGMLNPADTVGFSQTPYAISADNRGNAYITGSFNTPAIIFDSDTIWDDPIYATDVFIVKYDALGNLKWAKGGTQANDAFGSAISADTKGNVYAIIGGSYDSLFMDGIGLQSPDSLYDPVYILKMDSSGHIIYHTSLPSGGDDQIGLSCDSAGNEYVSGDYLVPMFIAGGALPLTGEENFFIAKLDTSACSAGGATAIIDSSNLCYGDTSAICGPSGYPCYQWSNGWGTMCIYTALTGNYNVTVVDNNGCTAVSNSVNLSFFQPTPVTISVTGDTLSCYSTASCQWYFNGQPLTGDTASTLIATQLGVYTVTVKDQYGCYYTSSPVGASINSIGIDDNIKIFPNPSTGTWQLAVDNSLLGSTIQIFSATGQLVLKSTINNQQSTISILEASTGVYELRIISPQTTYVRKLVKL